MPPQRTGAGMFHPAMRPEETTNRCSARLRSDLPPALALAPPPRAALLAAGPLKPDPEAVLDVALEARRVEHVHAEASRSRSAGLFAEPRFRAADKNVLARAALERLAAARAANLRCRSRSLLAMALYIGALCVRGRYC